METTCPKCQKKYSVPDELAGRQIRCTNTACQQVFSVPQGVRRSPPLQRAAVLPDSTAGAARVPGSLPPGMPPLPPKMPPLPDYNPPAQSPSDPLAFLQAGSDPPAFDRQTAGQRDSIASSGFTEGPPNLANRGGSAAVPTARMSALRHPKETAYLTIAAIAGTSVWLCVIPFVLMFCWVAIPIFIGLWITQQFYKAKMLGSSVKVSRNQYPELFEIVERHCCALGLAAPPAVFIVNRNGAVNAVAIKFLKDKYVLLFADLVDVMLAHGSTNELSSIIGHELGHHAAGHTAWWKGTLLKPAMFIPFLGGAYSRACELTADRIGLYLCDDMDAACRGLTALACGSKVLSPTTNLQAFKDQERALSWFFAFLLDLYSTHPRLTKRVVALEDAARLLGH